MIVFTALTFYFIELVFSTPGSVVVVVVLIAAEMKRSCCRREMKTFGATSAHTEYIHPVMLAGECVCRRSWV
jgi:hypothetical protein